MALVGKTGALLSYASKLTETPSLVDKEDIGWLRNGTDRIAHVDEARN